MLMSSRVIYTKKTELMYPEDPNEYPFLAAIFWLAVLGVIVGWWLLY